MKKFSQIFVLLLLIFGLIGCCKNGLTCTANADSQKQLNVSQQTYQWKLVTSWPKNFPGLGSAPNNFATLAEEMSGGRLKIKVFAAGELVPGFEVFDAVSQNTAEIGHSAAYYWKGKTQAAQIFTTVPFGMNTIEMNAWLQYGGGLELWQALYERFGVVPFPGGNSGLQFAGWFNKEINSLDDLKGLKMRIPGLAGEVMNALGATPVNITGGEIFTSLQTGAIDATEWVGPYNDLAFGLHKVGQYYYYSGWHEPGANLEFIVNKKALESLPPYLQQIVKVAMKEAAYTTTAEFTARNASSLQTLVDKHEVQLRSFPPEVMEALKRTSLDMLEQISADDPEFKKVWQSYKQFLEQMKQYHNYTDYEYFKNRG